jgi:hypothetical protein
LKKEVCGEERERGRGGCDAKQKSKSRAPWNPFVARGVSSEHKGVVVLKLQGW